MNNYIQQLQEDHQKQIAELKSNATPKTGAGNEAGKDGRQTEVPGRSGACANPKQTDRNQMEAAIVQAEKFKAQVENPKGMCLNLVDGLEAAKKSVNDDEYMHLTCHVEEVFSFSLQEGSVC